MNKESDKIRSFTDLNAWREGHKLILSVYKTTKLFPKEELFGLSNQMRRCSVSITSNIAEGFNRQSYKEKIHFYSISLGSTAELQNQLMIARDVGYIGKEEFDKIMNQSINTHKIINGIIKSSRNYIILNS